LAVLFGHDDADARKGRHRRKRKDEGRQRQHNAAVDSEKKKKKKKKKKCTPDSTATTCAGKCGSVTNNCNQAVDCGPCAGCDPACGTCCNDVCCSQAGAICAADTGACCVPEPTAETCNGKCEGVINNCGVKIDCW
jgi:hypothetical protein